MRWLGIAVLMLLVCGGAAALVGYASFEYMRVNATGEATAPAAVPEPGSPEAVMVAEAPAATTACADGAAAFAVKDYDRTTTLLDLCLVASPDRTDLRALRGRAWAASERYERAIADLEVAVEANPDDEAAWEALVFSQVRTENDRAALVTLDRWLDRRPDAAVAIRHRADVRYRLGQLGLAEDDAVRACALGDPDACVLESRIKDAKRRR